MKKKLLVLASTFPRWKNDTLPPFVYEISKRLTSEFDVSVLAPSYPNAKDNEVMDGINVHRYHYFLKRFEKLAGSGGILPALKKNILNLFMVPFLMLFGYLALRKLAEKIKPDIIHAHWLVPQGFFAALINKKYGIPFVVTAHGGDVFGLRDGLSKMIKKFVLNNAKTTIAVSKALKNDINSGLAPKLPVQIIPMGVDTKLFNPDKKDNELKTKLKISGPLILFVGRLASKKGVKYLIEAMPLIIERSPNTMLLIVGDGTQYIELEKSVYRLKIQNNVKFIGAVQNSELPPYYASADIFIGPSIIADNGDTEGLGVTFLEAMASGCIVVGTDAGGISDVIENNRTGFIVKQKDPLQISAAVNDILNDKYDRNAMKILARDFVVDNFDWEKIHEKYCEVLL